MAKNTPRATEKQKSRKTATGSRRKPKAKKAATASLPADPLKRHYNNNFLTTVIARIDFASSLDFKNDRPPLPFRKRITTEFPISETQMNTDQNVTVTPDGTHTITTKQRRIWRFHNKQRTHSVNLNNDYLSVECTTYDSYAVLRRQLLTAAKIIFDKFKTAKAKRLGLRYIDKIEFPKKKGGPTDWSDYLNPALLSAFNITGDRKHLSRVFSVVETNRPNGTQVRFQFGMPNPDFPAPIKRAQFTLDYDAYVSDLLSYKQIEKLLDGLHREAKICFENIITDELRKVMGVT